MGGNYHDTYKDGHGPTSCANSIGFETITGFLYPLAWISKGDGFEPDAILLSNGNLLIALTTPPDPTQAIKDDVFNENRMGLDHLSFGVTGIKDLENAVQILEAENISHGEIKDLRPILPIYVLAFRDPDNIQLELTAPAG